MGVRLAWWQPGGWSGGSPELAMNPGQVMGWRELFLSCMLWKVLGGWRCQLPKDFMVILMILLMAEIRLINQLRLVVFPIIYGVSAPSQVVIAGFQPSTVLTICTRWFSQNPWPFEWSKQTKGHVYQLHPSKKLSTKKGHGSLESPGTDYFISHYSKNYPTYPWNIPQTQNQEFMKGFLSFEGLGIQGVCSRGMLGFS